jgi:hypothetical protein
MGKRNPGCNGDVAAGAGYVAAQKTGGPGRPHALRWRLRRFFAMKWGGARADVFHAGKLRPFSRRGGARGMLSAYPRGGVVPLFLRTRGTARRQAQPVLSVRASVVGRRGAFRRAVRRFLRRRAALCPWTAPIGERSTVSELLARTRSGPGRSPGAARVQVCENCPRAPARTPVMGKLAGPRLCSASFRFAHAVPRPGHGSQCRPFAPHPEEPAQRASQRMGRPHGSRRNVSRCSSP